MSGMMLVYGEAILETKERIEAGRKAIEEIDCCDMSFGKAQLRELHVQRLAELEAELRQMFHIVSLSLKEI